MDITQYKDSSAYTDLVLDLVLKNIERKIQRNYVSAYQDRNSQVGLGTPKYSRRTGDPEPLKQDLGPGSQDAGPKIGEVKPWSREF